jgi:hypothetical protein
MPMLTTPPPKPIETEAFGRLFRSRLEARCAVFLEAMGLRWEYEPEGFQLPSGRYLPRDKEDANRWASVRQSMHRLRERIEALEARPIPGTIELAADLSTLDAKAWAYIGKQSICGDPAATALIDLLNEPPAPQPPAPQPAPVAAPAGGLVERVADAIGNADYDDLPPADLNRRDARAAIREVAAWLNERDTSTQNDPNCLEAPSVDDAIRWLREEAGQ